jgi:hypothetical protein
MTDLKKLQETLNQSKKMCDNFDRKIDLLKLEVEYQKYIKKFSPAYLSGSDWYVGDSIIQWINNQDISQDLLGLLFYWSHKLT